MNMYKKGILLLFIIIGQLSCTYDNCKGNDVPFYDIQNIDLQEYKIVSVHSDFLSVEPLNTNFPVTFDSLFIRLESDLKYYADARPVFDFSLMSSAYACDPVFRYGYKGTQERVDTILVTGLFDFDASHPAGTNLNDLFTVGYSEPNYKPLPTTDLNAFLTQQERMPPQHLDFRL